MPALGLLLCLAAKPGATSGPELVTDPIGQVDSFGGLGLLNSGGPGARALLLNGIQGDADYGTFWASDGTASGTTALIQLKYVTLYTSRHLILGNRVAFHVGSEMIGGVPLIVTDGTPAGTWQLIDPAGFAINDGMAADPTGMTGWFVGCQFGADCSLWSLEPTASKLTLRARVRLTEAMNGLHGTSGRMGEALWPPSREPLLVTAKNVYFFGGGRLFVHRIGSSGFESIGPGGSPFAALGRRVVFSVQASNSSPRQLWAVEDDSLQRVQLSEFHAGLGVVGGIEALDGLAYFVADDGVNGLEIWSSDGTSSGTRRLTQLTPADPFNGSFNSVPGWIQRFGGRLFFVANGGLWTVTLGGKTSLVKASCEGCPGISQMYSATHGLVFWFSDEVSSRIWVSTGTQAGSQPLTSVCRQFCSAKLVPTELGLFVLAGDQLWKTDGTRSGTTLWISGLPPGTSRWVARRERLFFAARGEGPTSNILVVADLPRRTLSSPLELPATAADVALSCVGPFGTEVAFLADSDRVLAAPRAGGSARKLFEPHRLESPACPIAANGKLFHLSEYGELLVFDSASSTDAPAPGNPATEHIVQWQNGVVFPSGKDLWFSDGTTAGTGPRHPLPEPISWGLELAGATDGFYLQDKYGSNWSSANQGVWRSNLLEPPQHIAAALANGRFDLSKAPVRVGTTTFFHTEGDASSLARTTETDSKPEFVGAFSRPAEILALPDRLLASAPEADLPVGLYAISESGEPTRLGPTGLTTAEPLARLGKRGCFAAAFRKPKMGVELWCSDGTLAGTKLIKNIRAGADSSHPENFLAAENLLYFSAHDGAHGRELWVTDGTTVGTKLAADLRKGFGSSDPKPLAAFDGYLYFSGNDGLIGNALWRIRIGS